MSEKHSQKEVRKDAILKLAMGLLVILIIANTIQLSRFGEIVERVDSYNKGVVDELGGFRADISAFGADINEMRSFLLLPQKEYSFMEKETGISEDEELETTGTQQAIYEFLGKYVDEKTVQKNKEEANKRIQSLNENENIAAALAESGLAMGKLEQNGETFSFKIISGTDPLYAVLGDIRSDATIIQSSIGAAQLKPDDLEKTFIDYVTGHKEEVTKTKDLLAAKKVGIANLINNPEIRKILAEKKLSIKTEPREDNESLYFPIMSSEAAELLTISLSRKTGNYGLMGETFEAEEQLAAALKVQLQKLDASTSAEKMIAARRAEIEAIINEEAFKDMLSAAELTADPAPRSEYNKLLYDIKDSKGAVQFSFVIELSSGLIKVLRDNREIDLFTLLQGSKKKP